MQIIDKKLTELIPYEKNPRKNDKAVKYVAESIKQFGFKVPIVIDKNNIIVAGHTRYKAAHKLGLKNVPCIVADDLTEGQIKAYRLADNKVAEQAEWDFNLLDLELLELEAFEFDMSAFGFGEEEEEPEVQEDDYEPEVPETPRARLGDIYQLGRHRLMCGDATDPSDLAKLTDGQQVDLFLTDPPYNVNYSSADGKTIQNDDMEDAAFRAFLRDAFQSAIDVMKDGASFYIWHADSEGYNFRGACHDINLQVRQCLIWNKNSLVLGRQDYQWKHEPCLYGWKDGAAHYFVDDRTQTTVIEDKGLDINKLSKEEMKNLLKQIYSDKISTTIINEDKPHNSAQHPTMKPLKLLERLVKNSTKADDIVLDSFAGSGSTLMTCEQLNRTCYSLELDPKYVDVIIDRWESFTEQKAIKLKGGK